MQLKICKFLPIFSYLHMQINLLNAQLFSVPYGPGLEPGNLVLPVRYIILESKGAFRSNGSLLEFNVKGLTTDKSRSCRIWSQILDRLDGSYILRYKLYETCTNLQMNIKYNGEHVVESPYTFEKIVLSENCYCPQKNINEWLEQSKCKTFHRQIASDLSPFMDGINWNTIKHQVIERFNMPNSISICNYATSDNKIYRKCYGKYVGFKMFMDNILLSMARKMRLPDMEFFVNLGDWPLVTKTPIVPVFSWCGSDDSHDIILPTYDITGSTLESMARVMLDILSVQGNLEYKWDDRIAKMFWRGRDSSLERLKLIEIAKDYPEMFNVSLTNFFFYRDRMDKYGPKTDHISFYKFFDYKYQINLDGTVAAYRLPYLLAGKSLVFKQESKYYEHFYKDLKEGEHYLPVKRDLSDLLSQLKWAMNNGDKAKLIAEKSQQFVNENLLPLDIFCYHGLLLNEYSKLLHSKPVITKDMELVEQPQQDSTCRCNSFHNNKDEL